jgi:hypothetical protein
MEADGFFNMSVMICQTTWHHSIEASNLLFHRHANLKSRNKYCRCPYTSRSQWPSGLSYDLSSPAQTLGSCVESNSRNGCFCEFIVYLWCSVSRQRPCVGLIPRPRKPRDCVQDQVTKKPSKVRQWAVESLLIIIINMYKLIMRHVEAQWLKHYATS